MDSRTARDGRVIEQLGTYDPSVPDTDARAILKGERIDYWISVGAKPTQKVATLIKKYGTAGTHLEAQATAVAKLGGRRAEAIEAAKSAASKVEMPKVEPEAKPEEAAAPEGEAPAEGAEAAADAPAEEAKEAPAAKAEEAPAEEAPAEEAPAEEKAEAPAEEKKAD
jgi:small subunit ribosomal protein S16